MEMRGSELSRPGKRGRRSPKVDPRGSLSCLPLRRRFGMRLDVDGGEVN